MPFLEFPIQIYMIALISCVLCAWNKNWGECEWHKVYWNHNILPSFSNSIIFVPFIDFNFVQKKNSNEKKKKKRITHAHWGRSYYKVNHYCESSSSLCACVSYVLLLWTSYIAYTINVLRICLHSSEQVSEIVVSRKEYRQQSGLRILHTS